MIENQLLRIENKLDAFIKDFYQDRIKVESRLTKATTKIAVFISLLGSIITFFVGKI